MTFSLLCLHDIYHLCICTLPKLKKKQQQPYFPLSQGISLDWGFPGDSVRKNPYANAGDTGSIPKSGRSPGEVNGNSPQYACQENPMDRGAWWATVCGGAQSWTQVNMHVSTHACPHLPRLDDLVGLFLHTVNPDIWQWALRFSLVLCSVLSYQTDDVKWGRSPTQWPHARLPRAGRLRHSSVWSPRIHPAGVASGAGVGWTLVTEPFFCLRETPRGRWSLPCT